MHCTRLICIFGFCIILITGTGYTEESNTLEISDVSASDEQNLPDLTENSSLSDYLVYGALNNPGLKAAFNRWKAAAERVTQARSFPDPRFNYTYYIREVETRVGPQKHKIGFSQQILWFGKLRLQSDIAGQMANAERQKYESTKLKLFYRIKEAYYEYYFLGKTINITEENLNLIKYLEEITRNRYSVGTATHAAIIKAQVEMGILEDRLRSLRELVYPLSAKLNAVLNINSSTLLPVPKEIIQDEVEISEDHIFDWIKENNPELKSLDFVIEKQKTAIDFAKKNYFPDLTFGLDYILTGKSRMPDVMDSGKDSIMAMISVTVPVFRAKYRAAEQEAAAQYEADLETRIDRENKLISDTKMALYNFHDAERKIDLYQNTLIPKAKQSLSVVQQGFIADKVDFLDLIDAQRTLLEFRLSFERAFTDRGQYLAQLEMLTGKEIPRSGKMINYNNED
ncbi:MAG: hypothetical protein A2161_16010 [Candidatus Schekmanbacteria bacterium RBG_13_48_7]|uniref:TolC family protein n=1 Tax=Candidatus Schekmanbacteria bacterium RBG_13_48_7 TaxID=1817878 RepID=A0A1F7RR63_9BACT|nr:MAG: hypothetical protein A2161_16010 [Candidatus Schekmanbacteria bacterium RBG_13_48_7]